MIKYNYTIRRNEGNEIKEYEPNLIPRELENLVYIQGPNSSGKSTLLNLIALGFFAEKLKDDELNPALKEKIEILHNSIYQNVTFDIEVDNPILEISLKTVKEDYDNDDIEVSLTENNRNFTISAEDFLKRFKIIYDIPSDPIRRLPELLKELKNSQEDIEDRIVSLRQYLDNVIREIKEGNNPDLLIEVKDNLESLDSDYNSHNNMAIKNQNLLGWLSQYRVLKLYFDSKKNLDELTVELNNLQKLISSESKKNKQYSKKESEIAGASYKHLAKTKEIYKEVTQLLEQFLPNSEKERLSIWVNSSCDDEIKQPDIHEDLKKEALFFIEFLKTIPSESDEELSEARLLKELLKILEHFRHTSILVPGTDKKVNEFIDILSKEKAPKEDLLYRNEGIAKCIRLLDNFLIQRTLAIGAYKELMKIKTKDTDNLDSINSDLLKEDLEQLQKRFNIVTSKVSLCERELLNLNISLIDAEKKLRYLSSDLNYYEKYKTYNEQRLSEALSNINLNYSETLKNLTRIKKEVEVLNDEKERLEKKEPHKYQFYLKQIESFRSVLLELERKFSNKFKQDINTIMKKGVSIDSLTPDETMYLNKVSQYLAVKLRFIRHIDALYEIKELNIITKEIITVNGKIIRFADLGTGQSQGAYLQGLLNTDDNRKIIALFDEVAMMDSSTLNPIFEKLKKLYLEKKLLMAIIVQRLDNELKVENLL